MRLDEPLGFLMNRTGRKLAQLLTSYFQPFDITTEQWSVLKGLADQEGISQKDLARFVEKDQTNVTRILDQLERKEWVRRVPNNKDRRSFLPYVTEQGRALIEKLTPLEEEIVGYALKDISDEKLLEFKQILFQMTENINQHDRMER